jgi:hypothetical protein
MLEDTVTTDAEPLPSPADLAPSDIVAEAHVEPEPAAEPKPRSLRAQPFVAPRDRIDVVSCRQGAGSMSVHLRDGKTPHDRKTAGSHGCYDAEHQFDMFAR